MTKILAKAGISSFAMGDDGLLRMVIRLMEQYGLTVIGVDELLSDLVAGAGVLGSVEPDADARADIARGREVARVLGEADVGQSVIIQQGTVLGVEAAETLSRYNTSIREVRDEVEAAYPT